MDHELALALASIDPAELGARVRRLRLERALTQGQVAADTISTAYLSRIETGLRRPEASVLEALASRLGVSARELLTGSPAADRPGTQVELDYAEMELSTGSAQAALDRLDRLTGELDPDHRQLATLLRALASHALGQDPIRHLRNLVAEEPAEVTTWLRAEIALCRALRDTSELNAAVTAGERALTRARDLGVAGSDDGIQLAVTLAAAYEMRGEIPKALRLAEATLAGADPTSTPRSRAYVYWNASVCEAEQGNPAAAIAHARQALDLLGEDGDARQRAMLRCNIGSYLLELEPPDVAPAIELLTAARHELALTGASATELAHLAVEQARGRVMIRDLDTAGVLIDEVLAKREGLGTFLVANALILHGQIVLPHDPEAAMRAYRDAVLALSASGQDRAVSRAWFRIAACFEGVGDAASALDAYKRAGIAGGMISGAMATGALA
jgi:transcriptional regulator with XRE-family HTH domain